MNVPNDQSIEDLLARLERERLDADRLYNDALTAVDRALQSVPALARAAAALRRDAARRSERRVGHPAGRRAGARRRLAQGSSPTIRVAPRSDPLSRRRSGSMRRSSITSTATPRRIENRRRPSARCSGRVGRELRALVRFESLLVQYLQTITVYVDSKDRSLGGSDIRQRLALTEQRLLALKRDVEQGAADEAAAPDDTANKRRSADRSTRVTYVQFEDRFRGSQHEIRARVEDYVPILANGLRRRRHRLRTRRTAGAAQGARHLGARRRLQRGDGRAVPLARTRASSRVTGCRIFNARQTAASAA